MLWALGAHYGGAQASSQAQISSAPSAPAAASRHIVDQYCVSCHNARVTTAATQSGVVLDIADMSAVASNPGLWEKVLRKLRAGTMPPQGARRPDDSASHTLIAFLEAELDRAELAQPHPGRPLLHRLNRTEYANAIHDLLALDVDAASLLPADDSAYGFDNVADVLGVSPSLQERYLSAAEAVAALAVGDVHQTAITDTYNVRQDLSQNQHIEGLPLGTMGGTVIRRWFPVDGAYDIRIRFFRTNFGNLRGLEHPHLVELAVDGQRVRAVTIGGAEDLKAAFEKPTETADALDARFAVRLPLTAGPHTLTVAFVESQPLVDTTRLEPFLRSSYDTLDWTGRPHLDRVTITGPFDIKGPGHSASRARIFTCHPSGADQKAALVCATQILSALTRRAYREPSADADIQPILHFYEDVRRTGAGFDAGIQAGLQLILSSPKFVFRAEVDPPQAPPGPHRISDVELASRLSFFLWSTIPDDELLTTAGRGRLHDPAVLDQQVRRMVADPKSEALVSNFAGQWLQLRNLKTFQPNSDEFPDFDDNLRQAFQRETELFFESMIRDDRNVTLDDDTRRGLLGKGAILAVTSHATRTSPVERGKWILENVLGAPVPPPPPLPGAGVFAEPAPGVAPKTMREQMANHRKDPVCAACHSLMDPIGISLENFDAVGAWRTREPNGRVDASGQLSDGTDVTGVVTLREALMRRPDVFVTTLTEKLMTYALGRGLDDHDMPAVRRIVRNACHRENTFSSLVLGIVQSVPFQMRAASDERAARK